MIPLGVDITLFHPKGGEKNSKILPLVSAGEMTALSLEVCVVSKDWKVNVEEEKGQVSNEIRLLITRKQSFRRVLLAECFHEADVKATTNE